jgi:hypothetical protein
VVLGLLEMPAIDVELGSGLPEHAYESARTLQERLDWCIDAAMTDPSPGAREVIHDVAAAKLRG